MGISGKLNWILLSSNDSLMAQGEFGLSQSLLFDKCFNYTS